MVAAGLLVLASVLAFLLLWYLTDVGAQVVAPVACAESVACLRHRVKDLQDYRDFVDDQLALAKALNQDLQGQLEACRGGKELPPRGEPPAP